MPRDTKPAIMSVQRIQKNFTIKGGIDDTLYVFQGLDARYDVEGSLLVTADGFIQFHGQQDINTVIPRCLLRLSRNSAGDSINNSKIERATFSGRSSLAHFINDGAEKSKIVDSTFVQQQLDASCVVYSNLDRPNFNDITNRQFATNSGHKIENTSFYCEGRPKRYHRNMGACIRGVGEFTDAEIVDNWFSGGAPALVLVNNADEGGPGWGRDNSPKRIVIRNNKSESEGSKLILLFGVKKEQVLLHNDFDNGFKIIELPFDYDSPYLPGQEPIEEDLPDPIPTNQLVTVSLGALPTIPTYTTIKESLVAGDYMKVDSGRFVANQGNYRPLTIEGTRERPVLVEFSNTRIACNYYIRAKNAVIRGLDCHKIELRNCFNVILENCIVGGEELTNQDGLKVFVVGNGMTINADPGKTSSNIIVRNVKSEKNGHWTGYNEAGIEVGDEDVHGCQISARVNDVLFDSCQFNYSSGDGVQIEAGSKENEDTLNRIFFVNCSAKGNKQSGFHAKRGNNIVYINCTAFEHDVIGAHPSSYGAGFSHQYGTKRIIYINCYSHHNRYGSASGSTSGEGSGIEVYFVECTFTDNYYNTNYPYNPITAWSNAGICSIGNKNKYFINNTIRRCDAGINVGGGEHVHIEGNVISDVKQNHIFVEESVPNLFIKNNYLSNPNNVVKIKLGSQTQENNFAENVNSAERTRPIDRTHPIYTLLRTEYGIQVS